MEEVQQQSRPTLVARLRRWAWIAWLLVLFTINKLIDAAQVYYAVIRREIELFVGVAFSLIVAFGFNSARFCDGNTADYLSCTRPTAYHYYGGFDIFMIVVGVFFILLWW